MNGSELVAERSLWLRRAGLAAVLAGLLLLATKLGAWWLTGSASVLAAAADGLFDLLSSAINLLAILYALRPADDDHRYGHGKAESLAAFVQALLLLATATAILGYALWRYRTGVSLATETAHQGIALILIAMAITAVLVVFQAWVIRRTGSPLVKADTLHYRGDMLINGSVLVALAVGQRWPWVDPLLAIAIAAYIARSAWTILRTAVDELLDRELPPRLDEALIRTAIAEAQVQGVHNLKTRRVGGRYLIQMDLEFDPEISLANAHDAASLVRRRIESQYPVADIIIHMDPGSSRASS